MSQRTTPVLPANDPAALQRAADTLQAGGLVAFPTDTVYGLAAHALQPAAVERVYEVKGRVAQKALPVMVARVEDLPTVAQQVPAEAYALARRYWPGALTIVLRKHPRLPDAVTSGGPTVAVRIPDHPVPLRLITLVGAPLAVTSANHSGNPSPTTADGVARDLGGLIDLILDGGRCPGGVESTVIDLSSGEPIVLRAGAIPARDLERTLGKPVRVP